MLDAPFRSEGNIATAGGCMASQYLGAGAISRTLGDRAVRDVIGCTAPVGEQRETVDRVLRTVRTGEAAALR
ncbi:hypothetical protein ACFWPQ_23095 [Streptomyces sp. NPDC058464]|uniref:hypothetical protein n=1 Tax=Streptomyces sp. NPDC058464 TaxID=3346511 RepID=UPI0036559AE5